MPSERAHRPERRHRRRLGACLLAVAALVGLGTGSASQLSIAPTALAAGATTLTAPCHGTAPVRAVFASSYNPTTARYEATGVSVTGINAACSTRPYQLRVVTTTSSIGDLTGTVSAAGQTETETFAAAPVDTIVSVAVVIP